MGNEPTQRLLGRLCRAMIRVRFEAEFLSTKHFATQKFESMNLARLQTRGSI
jgi:hypothetical protein